MSFLFSTDGILYRIFTWIYLFLRLTGLCALASLPVITIPASLAAMFAVARYSLDKEEPTPSLWVVFWNAFRKHFRQSLVVGGGGSVVGFFLVMDLILVYHLKSQVVPWILFAIAIVGIAYVSTSLYVLPVMIRADLRTSTLIATAMKVAIYKPQLTIFNLVILFGVWFIGGHFPSLFLLFGIPVAVYTTSWITTLKMKSSQDTLSSDIEEFS